MTTQVLCVMENHSPSSPYYPLQSTIFSSDFENDKDCESSESSFDILGTTKKQQLEKQNKQEKQIIIKEEPLPSKKSEKSKEIKPILSTRGNSRSFLMLAFCALRKVTVGILSCVSQTGLGLLDFIIRFCMNEGVHNVLMVTLTVTVEVLVIMVFAVATILATVIINVDDAYRNRRKLKSDAGRVKAIGGRSELHEDTPTPVNTRSSRTRLARRENITKRRALNSNLLTFPLLEISGNVPNQVPTPLEVANKNEFEKATVDQKALSEASDNDVEAETKYDDSTKQEEDKIEPLASADSEASESSQQQNLVINKQSTIYRTQILTIQDNETLLKKKNYSTSKSTINKNSEDGVVTKEENEDENDLNPIEASSNEGENQDRTSTNISAVIEPNVFASLTESNEMKCENGKATGDIASSFVSTKRLFEHNI